MHWLLLVAFIAAHLAVYVALIRHLQAFRSEGMIVAYHGIGFALVVAVAILAFARAAIGPAALCGLIALQFIYSLSFLELWTLSEGSYSLQILLRVARRGSISREQLILASEAIGAEKKCDRLADLLSLKLIAKRADGHFELSTMGQMLVGSLGAVMRLVAIREQG